MNKNLLKAEMLSHNDTPDSLAEALGIHRGTLSAKMNEYKGAEFTQGEIGIIVKRYSLSTDRIKDIFFTEMVS